MYIIYIGVYMYIHTYPEAIHFLDTESVTVASPSCHFHSSFVGARPYSQRMLLVLDKKARGG